MPVRYIQFQLLLLLVQVLSVSVMFAIVDRQGLKMYEQNKGVHLFK
jgi:hypothetical protein